MNAFLYHYMYIWHLLKNSHTAKSTAFWCQYLKCACKQIRTHHKLLKNVFYLGAKKMVNFNTYYGVYLLLKEGVSCVLKCIGVLGEC